MPVFHGTVDLTSGETWAVSFRATGYADAVSLAAVFQTELSRTCDDGRRFTDFFGWNFFKGRIGRGAWPGAHDDDTVFLQMPPDNAFDDDDQWWRGDVW